MKKHASSHALAVLVCHRDRRHPYQDGQRSLSLDGAEAGRYKPPHCDIFQPRFSTKSHIHSHLSHYLGNHMGGRVFFYALGQKGGKELSVLVLAGPDLLEKRCNLCGLCERYQ